MCEEIRNDSNNVNGINSFKQICKNCVFCHEFKSLKDGEWYISSCCTYFVQTINKPKYDDFVIEVCTDDTCESFSEKR